MDSATVSTKSPRSKPPVKPAKERILIEFPAAALRKAEKAARAEGVSRSDFIRTAVEQRLAAIAEVEFERELEESYKANAEFNRQMMKEFEHVDREGWEAVFGKLANSDDEKKAAVIEAARSVSVPSRPWCRR